MRIWEVSTNTDMMRFYFFPTKKEAEAFARKEKQELRDEGYDVSDITVEIDSWEVKPNAKGIAKALNQFISYTCTNEG